MTVATVLRSGGAYGPEYVDALRRGVNRYLRGHRFLCLSDTPVGIWGEPLAHEWPGWWAKVELFRPGLFDGLVLYLDLDTLVVGPLEWATTYAGQLAVLGDLFQDPNGTRRTMIGSGVMLFRPGPHTEAIYEAFTREPEVIMSQHTARSDYWYKRVMPDPDRIQAFYPGMVESSKREAKDGAPDGCSLVCAHGRPRLHEPRAGWAHRLWSERAFAHRARAA